jgi:hypothetical protein
LLGLAQAGIKDIIEAQHVMIAVPPPPR